MNVIEIRPSDIVYLVRLSDNEFVGSEDGPLAFAEEPRAQEVADHRKGSVETHTFADVVFHCVKVGCARFRVDFGERGFLNVQLAESVDDLKQRATALASALGQSDMPLDPWQAKAGLN